MIDREAYRGSFSGLALRRWLEVTLPLTLLTLAIAYYFFRYAKKHAKRKVADRGLLPLYDMARRP